MTVAAYQFVSGVIANLRDMIGDSIAWRSIVELPDAEWADVLDLIGDADAEEATALTRIRRGVLAKTSESANYVALPRCGLRLNNDLRVAKTATTGFEITGSILAFFEIPIPTAYRTNNEDAYDDLTNKMGAIMGDLLAMYPQAGRIEITEIELDDHGRADPNEHQGEVFVAAGLNIYFRGGTG